MILDLAAVHFKHASLHAAWTARFAHFLEYVDLMPEFAPAFEAYARLAGEILTLSLVAHTHPGKGLDALHVHPCVGGRVDLGECLAVRWTGEAGASFAVTYTRQGASQPIPFDAADLDRAFRAFLAQYFPAERFAMGAYPSPRILTSPARRFIGVGREMSLVKPVVGLLWRTLMPLRAAIPGRIDPDRYLLKIYPDGYFEAFDPQRSFVQWAAYAVAGEADAPEGLAVLDVPAGLYAVWHYKGSSEDPRIFQHIFGEWLLGSGFVLDARPHFDVLGENYRNTDPESEEEIWIPVRMG